MHPFPNPHKFQNAEKFRVSFQVPLGRRHGVTGHIKGVPFSWCDSGLQAALTTDRVTFASETQNHLTGECAS